jgi:hypothetical protein
MIIPKLSKKRGIYIVLYTQTHLTKCTISYIIKKKVSFLKSII